MPDINLTCAECQNAFYFTERDQEFYREKNFQPPKRCFQCRQKRKANSVPASAFSQPPSAPPAGNRRSRRNHDDD